MPCQDCAGVRVELLSLKEFIGQWFNILISKVDGLEESNRGMSEKLGRQEDVLRVLTNSPTHHDKTQPEHVLGQFLGESLQRVAASPTGDAADTSDHHPRQNFNVSPSPSRPPPPLFHKSSTAHFSALEKRVNQQEPECSETSDTNEQQVHFGNKLQFKMEPAEMMEASLSANGTSGEDVSGGIAVEEDEEALAEVDQLPVAASASTSAKGLPASVFMMPRRKSTGEVSFVCRLCQTSFSQRSNLKRHINVLHQGMSRHPCRYCGKVFAWKGAWRRHEQRVHERFSLPVAPAPLP